jgi:hypothetical protein
MRNISFSATTEQIRQKRKHCTRRGNKNGPAWKSLKPNEHLMGVEKCQGLKKGEHVKQLSEIVAMDTTLEPVDDIIRRPTRECTEEQFVSLSDSCHFKQHGSRWCNHPGMHCTCDFDFCPGIPEVDLEGFPEMTPEEFVEMFCRLNGCQPDTIITRILFNYLQIATHIYQ